MILNSFEEAFSLLIREIETIRRDDIPHCHSGESHTLPRPHSVGISAIDTVNNLIGLYL
jgi:hypothetical protein